MPTNTESQNQTDTNTAAPSTTPVAPKLASEGGTDTQFNLLVAEKRAAGLTREDAEQIARKQLAHDATLADNRESDDALTLTQLRKQIETLVITAGRLARGLERLEKLNVVTAPPAPSLN